MGYPVSYRGGRGPQRGPLNIPAEPPLAPGPFLALGVMAWAFGQLAVQLQGAFSDGGGGAVRYPGAYGWTLTHDCGYAPVRLPSAAFASCPGGAGELVVSTSAWANQAVGTNNPNNPTVATICYWDPVSRPRNSVSVYAKPAQRWIRGTGGLSFPWMSYPANSVLLGGPIRLPVAVRAAVGMRHVGYDAAPPLPGRLPGFDVLDNRWDIYIPTRPGTRPGTRPDVGPIPRPVARAVPASGMREVKFNANTRAGRMFFAMYSAFNLLGDVYGFTRALWFAIPSEKRGSSMRLGNMVRDIWTEFPKITNAEFIGALRNIAFWKFNDALYGGTQGAMFNTIAQAYGYPLARVWATLESEVHTTYQFHRRRLEREQDSQRGG